MLISPSNSNSLKTARTRVSAREFKPRLPGFRTRTNLTCTARSADLVMSEVTCSVRDVVDSWFDDAPSSKEGSGLFTADDAHISLPLKKRLVTGTVDCDLGVAETVEILSYLCEKDCSATFKFPLPSRSAVYKFEARVGDKVIRTQTKKKAKAEAEFHAAVQQGHTAVIAKQASSDIYCIDLGNLPANQPCEIKIGYLRLLDKVSNTVEYVHTATWVPPYQGTTNANPSGAETASADASTDAATPAYTAKASYTLGYKIRLTSQAGIKSIDAGSPVTTVDGPHGKIVNFEMEVADAGKDFELVIELQDSTLGSRLQRQVCLRGEEQKTVLLATFVPRLPASLSSASTLKREVWLVVDCSGSMMGDPIRQAREASLFFIKDMPLNAGVRFNIVAFGDDYTFMYPEARLYDEATNAEAVKWVNTGLPCMGGTEILKCLSAIDKVKMPEGYARQVIFLTDGGVCGNEEEHIVKLAKKVGGPRYFSLGIGHGVHRSLLISLAEVTSGVTQFVAEDSAITRRCNILKKCAMADALLCKPRLLSRNAMMHLVPAVMPDVLFPDQPVTILAEVTAQQEGASLELSAQLGNSSESWKEELKLSEAVEADGDMLPVLHAMGYVTALLASRSGLHLKPDGSAHSVVPSREVVEEEVVRVAVAENLVTPLTASVGVLLQADPLDPAKVERVEVPLQIPHGRTLFAEAMEAMQDDDEEEAAPQYAMRSRSARSGYAAPQRKKMAPKLFMAPPSGAPMFLSAAPAPSAMSAIAQNIEYCLARGEKLEMLQDKSETLVQSSKIFAKQKKSSVFGGVTAGLSNAFGALTSLGGMARRSSPAPPAMPSGAAADTSCAPPPPPSQFQLQAAPGGSQKCEEKEMSRKRESSVEEVLAFEEEEQEDDMAMAEADAPEPRPVPPAAPAPAAAPAPLIAPASVKQLNDLRSAEGSWASTPALLAMVVGDSSKQAAVQAARPDGVGDDEWVTLLVLAYLRKHKSADKAVWEGMADKAMQWLQQHWPAAARSVAMTIIAVMKLL